MPSTPPTTEAEWQQQALQLAKMLGWRHMHVRRSIGKGRTWTTATSVVGWPDATLWNEKQRRLILVEFKSEKGKPTPEQVEVMASLEAAGQEVYLWRPSDLDAAHRVLRGPRPS